MKHFIGGYEVSAETKIAYERKLSDHIAEQSMITEAVRKALMRPCRAGWNVVCDCQKICGKSGTPIGIGQ